MSSKISALRVLIREAQDWKNGGWRKNQGLPFQGSFVTKDNPIDRLLEVLSTTDAIDYLDVRNPEEAK